MATNDSLQRYIDAGIAFTNMTRKKAEELVTELVQNGDLQTRRGHRPGSTSCSSAAARAPRSS